MSDTANALRTLTLTEEEIRTAYVLIGATIERVASEATVGELLAALRLLDRFKTEDPA